MREAELWEKVFNELKKKLCELTAASLDQESGDMCSIPGFVTSGRSVLLNNYCTTNNWQQKNHVMQYSYRAVSHVMLLSV